MIDLGVSKMALIGAVALIVIGPQKLPQVARTLGAFIGKAQRYITDVREEVKRAMELEALKDITNSVEEAATSFHSSMQASSEEFLQKCYGKSDYETNSEYVFPQYRHHGKSLRLQRVKAPYWYRVQQNKRKKSRSHVLSVAARISRK